MNMTQLKLTIAISTFNRYQSLKDYLLPSIEKITYSNYEVIFIDDHSTDETYQLLNEYKNKHSNLRIYRNSKNRGTPFSRNYVATKAKGEIIVFADDDVELFPNCLDEVVKLYLNDADLAMGWGCVYQCHGNRDRNKATFGTGSLFFIKKSILDYIKFDTNLRYFRTYVCEEHEFARRVRKNGLKIIRAEKVKVNHYQAPSQNRIWRGLGGDLNYLYEQLKKGSLFNYYFCIFKGFYICIKLLSDKDSVKKSLAAHPYKTAILMIHRFLVIVKTGDLLTASKWLFYITVDIPIRAKSKTIIENKKIKQLKKII